MCVVSNVGDHYGQPDQWPWQPAQPTIVPNTPLDFEPVWRRWKDAIENQELADLKKRVEALEDLLKKAKEFDTKTGRPDCELEAKKDKLRKQAKKLGVEISFP
jgi:hypothetical protein